MRAARTCVCLNVTNSMDTDVLSVISVGTFFSFFFFHIVFFFFFFLEVSKLPRVVFDYLLKKILVLVLMLTVWPFLPSYNQISHVFVAGCHFL